MRKTFVTLAVFLFVAQYAQAGTWTELDYPESYATTIYGIDGSNLVGSYNDDEHAFSYDGSTWTNIDKPGAWKTRAIGIDGSNIVGMYKDSLHRDHGYLYNKNAQTWTDLPIWASDIDGSNIVGGNELYNMDTQTVTAFDAPGAIQGSGTFINGIDGSCLVGHYFDTAAQPHGFLYDMDTQIWATLDAPGAMWTYVYGISGSNIVGSYRDTPGNNHGFLYNGTIWTTIDKSGATYGTHIYGIDGNKLVGEYVPGNRHGFVYEIPEPASAIMLALGTVLLTSRRKQHESGNQPVATAGKPATKIISVGEKLVR